jgi:C1A family cysteine protease
MEGADLKTIRAEILRTRAAWKAKDSPLLRLSGAEAIRRLGIVLDERDLADLRALPTPDMARVVAQSRGGLRLAQPGASVARATGAKKGRAARALPRDDFYVLDAELLDRVRKLILRWPRRVDWRNRKGRNNVTPVRDQGGCGSCVAFGTTATLESMILIEHVATFDLSEAELLFCGGGSCGGWWPSSAVTYLMNKGISLEACFPYAAHNMSCTTCVERDGEAIKVLTQTTIFDMTQRKQYLTNIGPMMCVFEVYGDFFGYASGVYSHVSGSLAGLHCVEVIGFDDLLGCWICKNSWGAGWGDAGFFRIAYGQGNIDSGFPFWGISGTQWSA